MPEWISCSGGFIEADVVRWTEAVWKTGRRKGSKPVKIGERIVVAQVARVDDTDASTALSVAGEDSSAVETDRSPWSRHAPK